MRPVFTGLGLLGGVYIVMELMRRSRGESSMSAYLAGGGANIQPMASPYEQAAAQRLTVGTRARPLNVNNFDERHLEVCVRCALCVRCAQKAERVKALCCLGRSEMRRAGAVERYAAAQGACARREVLSTARLLWARLCARGSRHWTDALTALWELARRGRVAAEE